MPNLKHIFYIEELCGSYKSSMCVLPIGMMFLITKNI